MLRLRLVILNGPAQGNALALPQGHTVLVGRDPQAQLNLPDPAVTRRHCQVTYRKDGVWVRDLNSDNGTWLNDTCVDIPGGCPMRPDDVLRVGRTELRLEVDFTVDPRWLAWNDGLVLRIARRIAEENDFAALPVLADALEEAGCTDPDLLAVCRAPGERPHGSCVIDALFGRPFPIIEGEDAEKPLALISDIHANLEALQAVLHDIDVHGVRGIYCLGDIVGYGPNPCECIDLMMRCQVVLLGNHDHNAMFDPDSPPGTEAFYWTRRALDDEAAPTEERERRWEFLAGLPREHRDEDRLFVHGSPRNPVHEFVFPEDIYSERKMDAVFRLVDRYCFHGHTHVPGVLIEERPRGPYRFLSPQEIDSVHLLDECKTMVNVGSVGQPRDGDWRACYVLLQGDTVTFRRVEYDVDTTIRKVRDNPDLDDFLGGRLRDGR